MMTSLEGVIHERLHIMILACLLGMLISWIASLSGYYRLPQDKSLSKSFISPLQFWHVAIAFALFLSIQLVLIPLLFILFVFVTQGKVALTSQISLSSDSQGYLNIISIAFTACVMMAYFLSLNKETKSFVWGDGNKPYGKYSSLHNILVGTLSWFIVFPWIMALSQLIGIFQDVFFEGSHVDQVAVKMFKDVFDNSFMFWCTLFEIAFIVPCIEELLFRGFLQNFLKTHVGIFKGVLFTSLIFASFHYSADQGIENIELVSSLFILSCFLGFLRERQNSLWASIALHSTFNLVSLVMIFLGY